MSSTIRDQEKLQNRQLETLKSRQNREISKLNNAHQDYKAELKKTNADEIVDIQNEHQRQVNVESDKKEKVLSQMKDHLQKTKEMTDKELRTLKENSQKNKSQENDKLALERDRLLSEQELYLNDINHRFNEKSRMIQIDGQDRLKTEESNFAATFSEKEGQHSQKINEQTNEFVTRYKKDGDNYTQIKNSQDSQFKKERLDTNLRQQTDLAKLTDSHNQHIEVRDNEFRKGLKEQDLMFEDKYASTLKRHNEDIKRLSDKNDKVVTKLKEGLKSELKTTVERSDDPFYQFTELRPQLRQLPDRVEIQVKVPEHAKKDLQLTINNKEAIINFNRRHDDTHSPATGLISKVHKVETYTTRMMTDAILNPKSVKSSFDNGVMTYVIMKA